MDLAPMEVKHAVPEPLAGELVRFATALREHDMLYPYSDDVRIYWNEAARRDALIDDARRQVAEGEPLGHLLALVELEARKQFPTLLEAAAYVEQFEMAVTR